MPLESCIMCLDLSDYMRNGDYPPSRLDAQYDAACLLGGAKLQQNPESSVGVIASSGKGVNILASPTADLGKLLACLHGLRASGAASLVTSIKTAQLALKHRKNRNGAQRIVLFVGSPIEEEERELTRLGAVLKKSSIAVDVIAMGENEGNGPRLRALVEAADSGGNSRLLVVPAGVMPSDVLSSHAILLGDEAAAAGARGGVAGGGEAGAGFAEFGGVDPAMDPELAMALRVSMEEARAAARDPAAAAEPGAAAAAAPPGAAVAAGGDAPAAAVGAAAPAAALDMSEEDLLLQQALAMSAEADTAMAVPATPAPSLEPAAPIASASAAAAATGVAAAAAAAAAAAPEPAAPAAAFSNPDFVQSLLGGLPGVDLSDPDLQAALLALSGGGVGGGGQPPTPPGGDAEGKK